MEQTEFTTPEEMKAAFGKRMQEAFAWWERQRLLFNIVVGTAGLLVTIMFCTRFTAFELFGAVAWGVMANILYCMGFILEVADMHYFRGIFQLHKWRILFLVLGTTAYAIVSVWFGTGYYMFPFLP